MEIQGNKSAPQTSQDKVNPANPPEYRVTEGNRIPMSVPNTKLSVPEMPGFWLYWHLGKNVRAAQRAGYTFVEKGELDIAQMGVANDAMESGTTDLGSRISVSAGNSLNEENQSERLYLMKLRNDWHESDVNTMTAKNEDIAQALRSGLIGANEDPDKNKRYMKKGQDLFYPKNKPAR